MAQALAMSLLPSPFGEGSRGDWRWAATNCSWAIKTLNGINAEDLSSCCLRLVTDEAVLGCIWFCPTLSKGKCNDVFPASSEAKGGLCKGFTDERGHHLLMHAKVIIGAICATGKNLDFSSSHEEIKKLSRQISVGRIKRKQRCLFTEGNGRAQRLQQQHYLNTGHAQGCARTLILLPWWSRKLSTSSPPSCQCPCYTEPQGVHEPHGIFYFILVLFSVYVFVYMWDLLLIHALCSRLI